MARLTSIILLGLLLAGCGGSSDAPPDGGDTPDATAGDDAAMPMSDAATPDGATPDAGPTDAGTDADTPYEPTLVQYVDPFIGTDDSDSPHPVPGGAGGSAYPGAVVPFGMVQLSPDTPTGSPSGYRYSDSQIESFSLTHFDGAGCPNNEDLPFLPIVGAINTPPATRWQDYRTGYDKASEDASPGYYRVSLDSDIDVELTTTTRTGLARFTYPATDEARVLLHTGRSATGIFPGSVEIMAPNKIRGTVTAGNFCGSGQMFQIHFVAEFDADFSGYGTWVAGNVTPDSVGASGTGSGAYLTFDTTSDQTVQMKIGLSFVSVANAELNLETENPGWDFERVQRSAARRWDEILHRIEVTGGSEEDLTKFYTALYRIFQNPNVASDVNGQYMGFDQAVHTADGWTMYQNFSGWDIIRSWTHFIAAVAPEGPDIIRSMVQDGIEGGLLPFWSHQSVDARVMVGDPGTVNVANAYAMGVRGFDTDAALELMVKSASNPADTHRYNLTDWITNHHAGNAAMTLEYAMADFAISQFAGAIGETATRDEYLTRAMYWRESWHDDHDHVLPRIAGNVGTGADAARLYEVQVFGPGSETNLALGGSASASATCNANENAGQAINGTVNGGTGDKWCDNTSADKWWQVDLGSMQSVARVVIHHAGAGGENAAWNTQDFAVETSPDGASWTIADDVTGNHDSVSMHTFDARDARYVRISITNAIQVRMPGGWDCLPFSPASECGFIEGNASQYVWMVPHDLQGVFSRMGGLETAIERLDEHFIELNAGTNRPYFYIGNEPEHGTPWTYNFAQAPWKTQELVRRIVHEEFTTSAGGLPGNDDLGATSAWLAWAYLGMYPVIPGNDTLVIHGPRFDTATVHLASGNPLVIRATGAASDAPYVQSLTIDGEASTKTWISFSDLIDGGTLEYTMGTSANEDWGNTEADRPPSFGP